MLFYPGGSNRSDIEGQEESDRQKQEGSRQQTETSKLPNRVIGKYQTRNQNTSARAPIGH